MTLKNRPRFDPHTLKELAGAKVYARGEAYFRDGLVDFLGDEAGRLVARVAGSEDYRTVVTGDGTLIDGECSCPAFEREGFCKHMVAVALAANAAVASGAAAGGGALASVRGYLGTKGVDALVEIVLNLAEHDPALLRRLEIAAAMAGADDEALGSQLRASIRDATRTRGYVDYRRAESWAAGVDAALDALAEIASGPRAALVVALADDALDRIEEAIGSIDDSDGHCSALLGRAQEIHLDACRAARPEPVALARDLFRRELEGDSDAFYGAAAGYEEVLGEDGLSEYRLLAQEAWEKLPTRVVDRAVAVADRLDAFRLASILDFFAERDGDVDARIALRAKDLSSPWAYLRLAQFCLEQGREEEALGRAEEGLWLFEDDRPDEELVLFAVDLLLKADRQADAEAHLWRAFKKEPSLTLYGRLRALGGEEAARRAIGRLQQDLVGAAPTPWHRPADLLVRVMIEEKTFDAAWGVVHAHGASRGVKEALARASETTHGREALAVYEERVEELARAGGSAAYGEAVALIDRMRPLRDAREHGAYVTGVRQRHKRKRNLMKLLE
jgi:uncharacterized Zn finger protein